MNGRVQIFQSYERGSTPLRLAPPGVAMGNEIESRTSILKKKINENNIAYTDIDIYLAINVTKFVNKFRRNNISIYNQLQIFSNYIIIACRNGTPKNLCHIV